MAANKAQIKLKIYDGTRQPFTERKSVLLRVHNGQTTDSFTKTLNTKSLNEGEVNLNVDFFDNFAFIGLYFLWGYRGIEADTMEV